MIFIEAPRPPPMSSSKFRCVLGALTLCMRECGPKQFDVRVVARSASCSAFEHALIIRPGTMLKLTRRRSRARFVQAKVFVPRLQYRGRFVAGGVLEIM